MIFLFLAISAYATYQLHKNRSKPTPVCAAVLGPTVAQSRHLATAYIYMYHALEAGMLTSHNSWSDRHTHILTLVLLIQNKEILTMTCIYTMLVYRNYTVDHWSVQSFGEGAKIACEIQHGASIVEWTLI